MTSTERERELFEAVVREKWPEPVAWRDPKNILPSQGCTYEESIAKRWAHIYTEPLYTEQQVRQLLGTNNHTNNSTNS